MDKNQPKKAHKVEYLYKLCNAYTSILFSNLKYQGTLPTNKKEVKIQFWKCLILLTLKNDDPAYFSNH
jgi:hypothetical protein